MKQEHFIKFFIEFFGYGCWKTPYWFIGIEEGGGKNINNVNQKLGQFYYWANIKGGLVDNFEFQSLLNEIKVNGFLDWTRKSGLMVQPTWIHPMKALLYAKNGRVWPELYDSKWSQIYSLGRQSTTNDINSTWIELFPLPNPGISNYSKRWPEWTKNFDKEWRLPKERKDYENGSYPIIGDLIDYRTSFIRNKIIIYKPKSVICYVGTSSGYSGIIRNIVNQLSTASWRNYSVIIKNNISYNILYKDIDWQGNRKTRVILTRHPIRTNHKIYWENVGKLII